MSHTPHAYTDADIDLVALALWPRGEVLGDPPAEARHADARVVLDALAAAGRLPAPHLLPLLNLTADEIEAIRRALMQRPIGAPHVSSALDKLTTTEEPAARPSTDPTT